MHLLAPFRSDLEHHPRWPALEGLRGIAMIGVVVYHVVRLVAGGGVWADQVAPPLRWLAGGRFGVDVLFVLSGFLVLRSWESIRSRSDSPLRALGTYAFRRGQRIYPAYWLSLLVLVPLLAPELLGTETLRRLFLFVGAQAYWVRGLPDLVNTVYWTLTTEVLFYVLLPLVAIGLRRRPWPVYLATAALSFAWVNGQLEGMRGELPAAFILGRLDQFVVGSAAAVLLTRHEQGRSSRTVSAAGHPVVPWIALATLAGLSHLQGSMLGTARDDWVAAALHPAVSLAFAALVLHLTLRPSPRFLENDGLRFIALISYSVYLWHFPILSEGLEAAGLDGTGATQIGEVGLVVAGLLVLVLVVSALSYLVGERPAMSSACAPGGGCPMTLPEDFWWGTAASSTQAEGAAPRSDWARWEALGKAPPSGDGNGFATRYADDFRLYASYGLTHHRLSIEWARIEPFEGRRDQDAIDHYTEVLRSARDAGVAVWVCLHHFTLPGWFSDDLGGFIDERGRGYHWPRHVDFVAETFGDLVFGWKPVNEPVAFAGAGWLLGVHPPGSNDPGRFMEMLEATHLANHEAWRLLRSGGKPVSTIHNLSPLFAADDRPETRVAVELVDEVVWGSCDPRATEGVLQLPGRAPIHNEEFVSAFDLIGFSYYSAQQVGADLSQGPYPPGSRVSRSRVRPVERGPHALPGAAGRRAARSRPARLRARRGHRGRRVARGGAEGIARPPRRSGGRWHPGEGLLPLDGGRQLRVGPRLRRALRALRSGPQPEAQRRAGPPVGNLPTRFRRTGRIVTARFRSPLGREHACLETTRCRAPRHVLAGARRMRCGGPRRGGP